MQNDYSSTLRILAQQRGIFIGTAVSARALHADAAYRDVLAREYNMLTPENETKFGSLVQEPHVYNFRPAEEIVGFAKANNIKVRGHTLVWHNQNPSWLKPENFTRHQAIELMQKHIFTTAGHFRGELYAWDVVNEAIRADGALRETFWLKTIGPDYLDYAFRFAREADPHAKLFYNEYGADGLSPKSDGMFQLLKDLQARGVPLDGVGLQMHLSLYDTQNFAYPPSRDDLSANLARLAGLGLEIHITELDVQIQRIEGSDEEKLARQAQVYQDVLCTALENEQLKAIVTWGFTDRYSWIPHFTKQEDAPLPFDAYYQPKPAYDAIYNLLEE